MSEGSPSSTPTFLSTCRLGDNTNDFGPRRPVNTIRVEEIRLDDGHWHTITLFQSWENVKLELDHSLVFRILNQRSFIFGNIIKNSDVYIGGLPQVTSSFISLCTLSA